tara:strand:+ start:373 stop:714 length:342 start_codon:yes stop_codon:yes gene_type:complete
MKWCFAHEHVSGNQAELADQLLLKQTKSSSRTQHFPSMPWRVISAFLPEHVFKKRMEEFHYWSLLFIRQRDLVKHEMRVWDEIDFSEKMLSIPSFRMKAGKVHRVPLSNQMHS